MPRFFLHVQHRSQDLLRDLEGGEYADLEQARAEAIVSAREIMASRALKGVQLDGSHFEIADETGAVVQIVSFDEAREDAPAKASRPLASPLPKRLGVKLDNIAVARSGRH